MGISLYAMFTLKKKRSLRETEMVVESRCYPLAFVLAPTSHRSFTVLRVK